ncbi:unnamed protein product [Arctia plantaginis]|uniref:HECT-type E3 ubiquitin transferase n=1 Tax=Arctia plantaginis TaxID=874455 RepID=A0A8S0ZX98_ARCPL|nr:unnamed protein product [Arctia plantaginis]
MYYFCFRLLSLDVSALEDVYWLEDTRARHVLEPKDFGAWSAARQSLPTGKDALQTLKSELWSAVVKNSKHQDAWTWGGMLVVSVSVCGLVTLAAMTQPSLAPEAKHSLLQYVTGKYLHPPSCKVEWGWQEPQAVGETMCFTVHCFQRNGQPYPICDTDELTVSISHGTRKVTAVIELGSGDPAQANTARVKFTVRTAGIYIISIMIGGVSVCGAPFRKWFSAGRVEARRSRVGRAHAALVFAAGHARALHVHPRDQYDNPAPLQPADQNPPRGFSIKLNLLGSEVDEALCSSATFSYDNVNQRVILTLCFERAGVYRAAVFYADVLLHNGEFDCIVLTASDTATVQRNISSKRHNICYEARLVSGKPRRVLCCISPKQLTLKDYIFKFIPKRITSFRLCPSTKLILKPCGGEFTLEDGVQPQLELVSAERDLIAATFTQLLIANCGGEDTFKVRSVAGVAKRDLIAPHMNKQDFFYSEIRKAHSRHPHEKLAIRVLRSELVRSSLKATRHFTMADWCKNFDVTFQGEQGVDWGGVRREWFSLLCGQLFDAKFGLFVSFHDSPTGLVHPNPDRPPHLKLKHFELAGKLVGKCLYESALGGSYRQLVRARLTRSFLAQIIGLRVHYKVLTLHSRAPSSRRSSACACTTRYSRYTHALLPRADHRPARALQGTHVTLTRSFLAQIIGLRVHYKVLTLHSRAPSSRRSSACACTTRYSRYTHALLPRADHRPARALQGTHVTLTRSFLAQIIGLRVHYKVLTLHSRAPSSRRSSACACTTRYSRYTHALLPRADHRPARALQGTHVTLTRSFLAQIIGLRVHYKVLTLHSRAPSSRRSSACACTTRYSRYTHALLPRADHRPARALQGTHVTLTRSFLAQIIGLRVHYKVLTLHSRAPSSRRSSACACTTRYSRYTHALLPRADHRPARALQGTHVTLTRSFLAQIIGLRVHYKVLTLHSRAPSSRRSSACACTTRYSRYTRALLPRADHRPARALQGTHVTLTRSFLAQIIGLRVHYKVLTLHSRAPSSRRSSACACTTRYSRYTHALLPRADHRPARALQGTHVTLTRSFLAQIIGLRVHYKVLTLHSRAPSSRRSSACACTTRYSRYTHALLPRADHRPARALQGTHVTLTRSFLAQIIGLRVHYKVLTLHSRAPSSRRSSACACTTRYSRYTHALLPRADHRPARALQGTHVTLTRSFLAQIIGLRVHYKVLTLHSRAPSSRRSSACACTTRYSRYTRALLPRADHRPARALQGTHVTLARSFLAQIIGLRVHYKVLTLHSRAPSSRRSSACACTTRYSRYTRALLPRADHRPARALQGTHVTLARSFLAQIIGLRVHYKYFEQDDPELYLSKIKYVLETDLDSSEGVPELYFAEDVYDSNGRLRETHDLIPNGSTIRVRNSTKISYLDALAQWRLAARVRAETDAFLRGLTLLVPDNLLAIFDENELELLVCGTGEVSVANRRWCRPLCVCVCTAAGVRHGRGVGGGPALVSATVCVCVCTAAGVRHGRGVGGGPALVSATLLVCGTGEVSVANRRWCRPLCVCVCTAAGVRHGRGVGGGPALVSATVCVCVCVQLLVCGTGEVSVADRRWCRPLCVCVCTAAGVRHGRGVGGGPALVSATLLVCGTGEVSVADRRWCRPLCVCVCTAAGVRHGRGVGGGPALVSATVCVCVYSCWCAARARCRWRTGAGVGHCVCVCVQLLVCGTGEVSVADRRWCRPLCVCVCTAAGVRHGRGVGGGPALVSATLLVCGTGEVSVADWRAHALVSGAGREWERLLGWLWAALANFSTEERARLLQFTTGCSQLPPGGFQDLNPRFQITPAPTFGALPTAHTCFNQLCLPDYDSYEQLVHALLWAINEGGEGFGMI